MSESSAPAKAKEKALEVLYFAREQEFRPQRAHEQDIGYDLFAAETAYLTTTSPLMVRTGITLALPDNLAGLILPRSSMGGKGIIIPNAPGLIDPGYEGEVSVLLAKVTPGAVAIERGTRIAQLTFVTVARPDLVYVRELHELIQGSERGDGGFGSTGA